MDKSRGQLRPKNSENSDHLVVIDEADFSGVRIHSNEHMDSSLINSVTGQSRSVGSEEGEQVASLPLAYRISSYMLISAVFISPFLFGGRSDIGASSIRATFFTYFLIRFLSRLAASRNLIKSYAEKKVTLLSCFFPSKDSYRYFAFCVPLICYLYFQTIALPYSVVSFLSPNAAEAYLQAGVYSPDLEGLAPLSLDPAATMDGLMWVLLFSILGSEFLGLTFIPKEVSSLRRGSSSRSRSRSRRSPSKSVEFGASYRLFDSFSETLHRSLVYLGVLLALVSVGHLSVGAEMLFGYFSPDVQFQGHSRAHWPFVSPNHLATILAISLVLVFVSILRERQLRSLRIEARRDEDSPVKAVIKVMSEWEQQGAQLLMFFIILLGLLLTGSRAAIFLSMCSISALWVAYRIDRVGIVSQRRISRSKPHGSGHMKRRSESGESVGRVFSTVRAISFPLVLLLLGLFFLGDSARNQLGSRVEDGIHRGFDDGRGELNGISAEIFIDNPFWGVGLNAWRRAATEYAPPSLSMFDLDYAHNELLQLLSEIGIFGFLLLAFPLIYPFFLLRARVNKTGNGGLVSFCRNIAPLQRFYLFGTLLAALLPLFHALVDFPFHMPAVFLAVFSCVVLFLRNIMGLVARENDISEKSLLH